MTVVVVGAGLAGLRVTEELRKQGYGGPLTVLGDESYPPYDRPPLSKEVLSGARSAADTRLRDDQALADLGARLELGAEAAALDPGARRVTLTDGAVVDYEQLVIATGLVPRTLPGTDRMANVHTLRTLDDCLGLRQSLDEADNVVVVGAGFIGCEVSATLRSRGLSVCLVEPQRAPLARVLGDKVGELIARWHRDAGVDLRCDTGAAEFVGDGTCSRVVLTDGSEVKADVVVAGIGSVPATEWLAGCGIELGNGVLCDERGRTSVSGVWALGDAASWGSRRVEHWTSASDQARVVARDMLGLDMDETPGVSYFWSDQYGLKLQVYGELAEGADISIVEDDGRRFLATCVRDGLLLGVIGAGMAGKAARLRRTIGQLVP